MTDEKAFVDSAVAVYCQNPATFDAQIGDWLKKYYEEAKEDQDRIVAEVWKRIHAGDETVVTMHNLILEALINAVGQLSPEAQRETVHGVLQIARRAKLAARSPAPEAEGVLAP